MLYKVFINREIGAGGPGIFSNRLIPALNKIEDIEVVTDVKKEFDIGLEFITKKSKYNKPYILRVDGCYYQEGRESGNRSLIRSIPNAKYIIFQSEFSYNLCKSILDIDLHNYSIIYNGIDLDYIKSVEPAKNIISGSFVACAGWRDNKRPLSTIKGFLKADTGRHLYMIGSGISKKYNSKYIHILGEKTEEETIGIMKSCKYLLHLCHIDSCPNVVVEGISCGLNVLCTNLGGTPEIVGNDGVILDVDKMWDGKYLPSTYKLDSLDLEIVANGVYKLMKIKTFPDTSKFDISNVAGRYADIIRKTFFKYKKQGYLK